MTGFTPNAEACGLSPQMPSVQVHTVNATHSWECGAVGGSRF